MSLKSTWLFIMSLDKPKIVHGSDIKALTRSIKCTTGCNNAGNYTGILLCCCFLFLIVFGRKQDDEGRSQARDLKTRYDLILPSKQI